MAKPRRSPPTQGRPRLSTLGKSVLGKTSRRQRVLLALGWFAGQIHHGVARYARDAGWVLNIDMMRSGVVPLAWKGDGIICILGSNSTMDRELRALNLPMINIGPFDAAGVTSVRTDNDAIAKLAVAHFLERGFRNFAYYVRNDGPGERDRLAHFERHVRRAGHVVHVLDASKIAGRQSESLRMRWLGRRLQALPKPLAAFSEYDDRSAELLMACELANIVVPEQIAVLGVDNDELRCEFATVPLSSIDDDQDRQGYEAARLLDLVMSGKRPPPSPILIPPAQLVTRQSTDILAIDHPHVAAALKLVWDHYRRPLSAEDIADMIPMSGRRLHDAFQTHVGRSIAAEIARRRVEHARGLLLETRKKVAEIAQMSGFASADHLCKTFKRLIGQTPQAFRKQASKN